MPGLSGDEEKALKAIILELVINSSGLLGTKRYISNLDGVIHCYSEQEIRSTARILSKNNGWIRFENDCVIIPIRKRNKARKKIKELRSDIYDL